MVLLDLICETESRSKQLVVGANAQAAICVVSRNHDFACSEVEVRKTIGYLDRRRIFL